MRRKRRVDESLADRLQAAQSTTLLGSDHSQIPGHIGSEACGEAACGRHYSGIPALRRLSMQIAATSGGNTRESHLMRPAVRQGWAYISVLAGGKRIEAANVIWCAGVEASPVARWLGLPRAKGG